MKSSKEALGAAGKKDVLLFDPEDLVLVEDKASPLYDERVSLPVNGSLVSNVKTYGVLEPVLVRKNPDTGKVEVIAGRQRVKACREANRLLKAEGAEPHRIPAVVKRAEGHMMMGMMISENEHRQDDSPLGKARKLSRFLELGRTPEEAGVIFGISVSTVKNMTGLLDASTAVQQAVERGAIRVGEAYKLSKLDPAEQHARLGKLAEASPSTPAKGKRTPKEARKAREAMGSAPDVRGKRELQAMLDRVANVDSMKEMHRAGAVAALEWALGKSDEIERLL